MPRISFLRKMIFDGRGRPPAARHRPNPTEWRDDAITGSCLGHSTVLVNFLGARVLTDPVFSQRAGPGIGPFILGPKRYQQPALPIREVPVPDVILLSHGHFDHFDVQSLRRFPRTVPVVTASKTKDLLRRFKVVHELAWGESVTLMIRGRPLRVESIPVAHWGARMMRDTYRGYGGFILERGERAVCFAGDTAYSDSFRALSSRPIAIDLALMPIGAYDPWIRAHCTPEQAVAMAEQAGAEYFVPIHHQTFKLSNEPMDEPAKRLRALFSREPRRLLSVDVGETFRVPMTETALSGVDATRSSGES